MFWGSALTTGKWGAGNACHVMISQLIKQPSMADFNEVSTRKCLGRPVATTTDHYGNNEDYKPLDFLIHLSGYRKKMTRLDFLKLSTQCIV